MEEELKKATFNQNADRERLADQYRRLYRKVTDFEANSAAALVKFSAGWVRAACPSSWRVTDGVLPTRADPLVRDGVVPCLDRDRPVDLLTRFLAWGMLPCLALLLAALVPLKDALRTARETGTFSLLPHSTSPGMVLLYGLGPFALALPLALYRLLKAVTRAAALWLPPRRVRYKDMPKLSGGRKLTTGPERQGEIHRLRLIEKWRTAILRWRDRSLNS